MSSAGLRGLSLRTDWMITTNAAYGDPMTENSPLGRNILYFSREIHDTILNRLFLNAFLVPLHDVMRLKPL